MKKIECPMCGHKFDGGERPTQRDFDILETSLKSIVRSSQHILELIEEPPKGGKPAPRHTLCQCKEMRIDKDPKVCGGCNKDKWSETK